MITNRILLFYVLQVPAHVCYDIVDGISDAAFVTSLSEASREIIIRCGKRKECTLVSRYTPFVRVETISKRSDETWRFLFFSLSLSPARRTMYIRRRFVTLARPVMGCLLIYPRTYPLSGPPSAAPLQCIVPLSRFQFHHTVL